MGARGFAVRQRLWGLSAGRSSRFWEPRTPGRKSWRPGAGGDTVTGEVGPVWEVPSSTFQSTWKNEEPPKVLARRSARDQVCILEKPSQDLVGRL